MARVLTRDDLVLSPSSEEKNYDSKVRLNGISKGQKKLLMGMIRLLTLWGRPGSKLVYAGAAPGTTHQLLSQMFPDVMMELYDPRPLDIKESSNIKIFTGDAGWFTDKVAEKYRSEKNIIFVSDIRNTDFKTGKVSLENEKIVENDMKMQRGWVAIMQPMVSMLKFRLPYQIPGSPTETEYLKGTILLQPYLKPTSSECRLVVTEPTSSFIYDNVKFEKMIFAHNLRRSQSQGSAFEWNREAERIILQEYLNTYSSYNDDNLNKLRALIATVVG